MNDKGRKHNYRGFRPQEPFPRAWWGHHRRINGPCTKIRHPQIFPDRFRREFALYFPEKCFWRFTNAEADVLYSLKGEHTSIYCFPKMSETGARRGIGVKEFPGVDRTHRNGFRWFPAKDRFGRETDEDSWHSTIYTQLGGKDE